MFDLGVYYSMNTLNSGTLFVGLGCTFEWGYMICWISGTLLNGGTLFVELGYIIH